MTPVVRFLAGRRLLSAVLLAAYFIPMVLAHRTVARWSIRIEKSVTYPVYNRAWLIVSLTALAFVLVALAVRLARGSDRAFRAGFLAAVFALVAASHVLFLAVNLEYIHILQFSLVVIPLFALSGRFGETVLATALLGAVDELYQYYVAWWPHQSAFDYNDIALDTVGGLFMAACLFLWLDSETIGLAERGRRPGWARSPALVLSGAVLAAALTANALGLLDFYPPSRGHGLEKPEPAPVLLSKDPRPASFWSVFEKGKTYHILTVEGWAVFTAGVAVLASLADRRRRR